MRLPYAVAVNAHPQSSPSPLDPELDDRVGRWLTVPDVAQECDRPVTAVRTWLKEGDLIALRRGERGVLSVPADFLGDGEPLHHLRGTITVLRDAGLDDLEIVAWLFAADDTLTTGSAIGDLRAGHKTEIRRRAAELAF